MEIFYNFLISLYAILVFNFIRILNKNRCRAMIAATTPPVPEWFEPENIPPKPENEIIRRDSDAWKTAEIQIRKWKFLYESERIIQWRIYYTDKMMEELYG